MDHFEIDDVISTLNGSGKALSRHLYSLWKHFPGKDLKTTELVKSHIEFQELVKADVIKLSPHSKYAIVDFGAEFDPKEFNKETGSYITKKYPIIEISDWEKIDEFDPQTGELGKQLELVSNVSKNFENVPVMMTIFLPVMVARKLVKDDNLIQHIQENKQLVNDRLQVITNMMTEFSKIAVELGSKGLFLATQETDIDNGWNFKTWKDYAFPFDRQVIENLRTKSEFQVLHLHGSNIFFKEILENYKVNAINFHSFSNFQTFFSKKEMFEVFNGGLLGGLNEELFEKLRNDIQGQKKQLNDFYQTLQPIEGRILLAPNCVLPQNLTNEDLGTMITNIRA